MLGVILSERLPWDRCQALPAGIPRPRDPFPRRKRRPSKLSPGALSWPRQFRFPAFRRFPTKGIARLPRMSPFRAALAIGETFQEASNTMSSVQRIVQDARFERRDDQFDLILTVDVGSEIVVERISLGVMPPSRIFEAIQAVLEEAGCASSARLPAA